MPIITLSTQINAPVERVFDLARSIDAHTASTEQTGERVVGGRVSGLLELGETVVWEARHFLIKQKLSAKLTALEYPNHFTDEMLEGAFSSMRHRHDFKAQDGGTLMIDELEFAAPLGVLGRLAEKLFLTSYMRRFIERRNTALMRMAEGDEWKEYLELK